MRRQVAASVHRHPSATGQRRADELGFTSTDGDGPAGLGGLVGEVVDGEVALVRLELAEGRGDPVLEGCGNGGRFVEHRLHDLHIFGVKGAYGVAAALRL